MPKKAGATIFGTSPKEVAVSIILIANALIWYFYYFSFLLDVTTTAAFSSDKTLTLIVWVVNFSGVALSALLSANLINRMRSRNTFLYYWLFAGAVLSLMPLAIDITQFHIMAIFSLLGGVYFGLGMPICFGYFASVTETRNRSRLSGITFLCIFSGFFFLSILNINSIASKSVVLAVWKFSGLLALLLLKPKEEQILQSCDVSYGTILRNRSFFLYFIPWLMFSVVNYLAIPIIGESFKLTVGDYTLDHTFLSVLENALAAVFAVVFGFLGDYMGRKRLTVAGFVLLGIGYASLGLFSYSTESCLFYVIVDGVAWGAFYTMFLMTLWGDLAQGNSSEKYYALGSLPYLFSNFMRISIGEFVGEIMADAIFSFVSVFLFLAVLPLIYAPETLPQKIVEERELKNYLDKARKEVEKAKRQEETNNTEESKTTEEEFEDKAFEDMLIESEEYS